MKMEKKFKIISIIATILTATIIIIGVSCSGNKTQESTPTEVIVKDTIQN